MTSTELAELLKAAASLLWVALAVTAFIYFRKQLGEMLGRVQSAKIFGNEFQLVQRNVEGLKSDVRVLKFLVASFVTKYQLKHLQNLKGTDPVYYQKAGGRLIEELIWLWDHGMIEKTDKGRSFYDIPESGNLKDVCLITQQGEEYLNHAAELKITKTE